MTFNFCAVYRS